MPKVNKERREWTGLGLLVNAAVIAVVAIFVVGAPASTPAPASSQAGARPTTAAFAPANAEQLKRLGSRDLRLHDPSSVVRCGDEYWLFCTGRGVPSHRSKDLVTWQPGPRVFPDAGPGWVNNEIPLNRNGNDFWAPEVMRLGGRYLVFYSVSSWGKNTSAIALASNVTLDPADAAYAWKDEGVVIKSVGGADDFNAIDPAPFLDVDGRLWMAFGSFWGGIKMVELDPATGRRIAADSPVHSLARKEQIEGPYVFRRGRHYYLLVAWGWCCRGVRSTYNVRIGRADRVTGPYVDRDGHDMRDGGGSLLLESDGPFIGPGQPSILAQPNESGRTDRDADRYHLVCHFYDATRRGRSTLAIVPLAWDADGWPVVAR